MADLQMVIQAFTILLTTSIGENVTKGGVVSVGVVVALGVLELDESVFGLCSKTLRARSVRIPGWVFASHGLLTCKNHPTSAVIPT